MTIDIIKAKNGWILHRHYVNLGITDAFVFHTLTELVNWIIKENEKE